MVKVAPDAFALMRKSILAILLLFSLSCQAVSFFSQPPSPTPIVQSSVDTPTVLPSPTSPARISQSLTPSPSSFITPSPTLTPTPVFSPTLTVTASPLQLKVFEELWRIVWDEYLYPDFNGLDWEAIYGEYHARISTGLFPDDFYQAMDEMISRLGDDHSFFLSPQQVAEEDAQFAGTHDYVGVGILVTAIPEQGRGGVLLTFPGGPADLAGIQARDSILSVDGESILDEEGYLRDLIRGVEGTRVTLTVQTPGGEPRQVTLTRSRITGSVPVPHQVLTTPGGKRVGYIFMVTFADAMIDHKIDEAIRIMSAEGRLDGLILDNRFNEGGIFPVFSRVLSFFTSGTLGHFTSREGTRSLQVRGQDISESQSVPLVALIGPDTASYGEVFTGILKDTGRAHLIGQATEGNIETLWSHDFEDGSRAWIAHESFQPLNNPHEDWERSGIHPHLTLDSAWFDIPMQKDPLIIAALDHLDEQ
jgi:carboxyl-terminal processing protease